MCVTVYDLKMVYMRIISWKFNPKWLYINSRIKDMLQSFFLINNNIFKML